MQQEFLFKNAHNSYFSVISNILDMLMQILKTLTYYVHNISKFYNTTYG